MTKRQAQGWLKRFENSGFVAYYSGLMVKEESGNISWGINVEGNGIDFDFGSPKIFWCQEQCSEFLLEVTGKRYSIYK